MYYSVIVEPLCLDLYSFSYKVKFVICLDLYAFNFFYVVIMFNWYFGSCLICVILFSFSICAYRDGGDGVA